MISSRALTNGYHFKDTPIVLHEQAFADDLSLIGSCPKKVQATIVVVEEAITWTGMQVKPAKCVCMGMKKFDPRWVHKIDYERYAETVYCPFDPNLVIGGKKLRFIVTTSADPESLAHDHFKELGRWISVDLREDRMKAEIRKRLKSDMEKVDASGVNGFCKLFLYEHFVVSKLSWPFLVHDLSLSFAQELDRSIIPSLKSWAGLFRGSDLGCLFRRRDHLGLQLTSISFHFQHMQIVKCSLLANSNDPVVRQIYELKKSHVIAHENRWSGPKALQSLEPVADHMLKFAGKGDRSGLGSFFHRYIADPTTKDLREKITQSLIITCEEKHLQHAACLVRQGVWSHYLDCVRPFDLSWNSLTFSEPKVISFVLNALINSVRTPDMLKLWGYSESAACPLCDAENCTLHHVLVNCPYALNQKRYTWRHDSVLSNIEIALSQILHEFNSKNPSSLVGGFGKRLIAFVRKGEKSNKKQESASVKRLSCANDWRMLVDFDKNNIVFPPEIFSTNERPDIVIWSGMARVVLLLELTCCAEEGTRAAHLRKDAKYTHLVSEINATKRWHAELFTLEVGARGLVGHTVHSIFKKIGLTSHAANALCKSLSWVVAKCSYAIYLAHKNPAWSHNCSLLLAPSIGKQCALPQSARRPNIKVLRDNGIVKLYHFTDLSNLSSIRANGLLSWVKIEDMKIGAMMNSSPMSRELDARKNLSNFVRLSLCKKHPMMFIALKEGRISRPVVLEIKLEIVSREGVLFCASNAAASSATTSNDPSVIHFEDVKSAAPFPPAFTPQVPPSGGSYP